MDSIEILERLSQIVGPSGYEDQVREAVLELVTPLADDVRTDTVGNVIATRRGRRDDVALLDAHMDEVGFLVSFIDEEGFLRLSPLGGWDARILLSHAVSVRTRNGRIVRGTIGTLPPHVLTDEMRNAPVKIEDLFVDVGARTASEVDDMDIGLGSPCTPAYPFERLADDLVMGKAFDDRAGCTIAIRALEELREDDLDLTVVAAFTTSEEVGLRGARAAAFQVRAKVALALECTTAVDVPGVAPAQRLARMGAGPAVTIADRSLIAAPAVLSLLEETAQKHDIPYHLKLPGGGGTDAAAIQQTAEGALCGVLSVPARYIHTPLSMLRASDLEATIDLAAAFARGASSLL